MNTCVNVKVEVDSTKIRIFYFLYGGGTTSAEKQIEDLFKRKFVANKKVSEQGNEYFSNEVGLNTAIAQGISEEQWCPPASHTSHRRILSVRKVLKVGIEVLTDTIIGQGDARGEVGTEQTVRRASTNLTNTLTDSPVAGTLLQQQGNRQGDVQSISSSRGALWWSTSFCKNGSKLALNFQFPFSLKVNQDEIANKRRKTDNSQSSNNDTTNNISSFENQIFTLVDIMKAIAEDSSGSTIMKTCTYGGTPETVRLRDIPERNYELILEADSMQVPDFLDLCNTAIDEINNIRRGWNVDTTKVDVVELSTNTVQQKEATHGNSKKRLII